MALPPYAAKALIAERLPRIFPPGTAQRAYCIRKIAASTVFALLYVGAAVRRGFAPAGTRWYADNTREPNVALLTAYEDRNAPGFKKTVADLAWGSFAWFASEPSEIVIFRDGASSGPSSLNELARRITGRPAR